MNRSSRAILALTAVMALLITASLLAQAAPPAETAKPAGQAVWITPFRGTAEVQFMQPVIKVDYKAGVVTTTIDVKNKTNGALVRLTVEEFWYDRAGTLIAGSKDFCRRPLKQGEVYTFTLKSPYDKRSNSNSYKFSHANGDVKPTKVKKFE